jgi:hypothetical protein
MVHQERSLHGLWIQQAVSSCQSCRDFIMNKNIGAKYVQSGNNIYVQSSYNILLRTWQELAACCRETSAEY